MKILITGSSGHLGEALMRAFRDTPHAAVGLDIIEGAFTERVGSIADRACVADCVAGCDAVIHTATLHKPHVGTHTTQDFVDTNITGTLNLLEESVRQGCGRFIFTSTTSTYGRALTPPPGEPAAWITEDVRPLPKNIYGVTKTAAEALCELFHVRHGLPCLVLKTSRFFKEQDDNPETRERFEDLNVKVNELLFRRVDIQDATDAHLLALDRAEAIGFERYIISATSPFTRKDLARLRADPADVVEARVDFRDVYEPRGWRMFGDIGRVYANDRARQDLGWEPRYTFAHAIERMRRGEPPFSPLTDVIGAKGYHPGRTFEDGPFPVV